MILPIDTTYSIVWLLPILIIIGAFCYYFYYRKIKSDSLNKSQITTLVALRFMVLLILGILLLSPVFNTLKREEQKPVIVFAIDNSQSMVLNNDSVFIKDSLFELVTSQLQNLGDKYQVRTILFGDSIAEKNPSYNQANTNFEQLFDEFNSSFFNMNVGALILASDGLYNKGTNPLYTAQNLSFPIYTLSIGDTSINADININKTDFNAIAFKGSIYPVEIGISASMMKGTKANIEILHKKKVLASKQVLINTNQFYKNTTIDLNADSSGIFEYEVRVVGDKEETNIQNNSKLIYIEVEDEKRKILLLQNGYHPDVAVFKNTIDQNPTFEIQVSNIEDFNTDISSYSLLILHQLPSKRNSLQAIIPQVFKFNIPILFVLGEESSIEALNNLKLNLSIEQKGEMFDEVVPYANSNFNLFNHNLSDRFLAELPPLFVPFGNYSNQPSNQILFYQQLGQIPTANPLWAYSELGDQKIGYIMGEGLWKWYLHEFKLNRDHAITKELITKTIQFLAIKNKKNAFEIDYPKTQNKNQAFEFRAKLFNASNEFVKNANINFELIDAKGNKYPHVFRELENEYILSLGFLELGKYEFIATAKQADETLIKTGTFIVKENLIEQSNLIANYNMLFQLAQNSGGKMYSKKQIENMFSDIETNTNISAIEYLQKDIIELISLKWVFIMLLLFLVLEWFLRKFWGLV